MELNDIRTLTILEKVQADRPPSQRNLARELNISVGLVNSFLKRLAKKGYVKVTTIPRNRVRYILTPKGVAEKSRLTCRYIQLSYQYYRRALLILKKLFADLEHAGVRRIVFYGATDLAEIANLALEETTIELVAVVDERRRGKPILGREVVDCDEISRLRYDRVVVTDEDRRDRILAALIASGVVRARIVFVE